MSPFDQFQRAPAPTAPPPQRLPAPAPRPVTRLPAPAVTIDPAEQERLRLAQEAAARAAESSARDSATTAATMGRFEADMADRERRLAAGPVADAAESERKGAGFYRRAINSESAYTNLDFDPDTPGVQDAQPRSYIGQVFANNAPDVLNSLPSVVGNSPQRQQADQAQREFIAAVLRYDSGAAIPEAEFESSARIYFPMPGDSREVIAQKARARRAAIEGLALSAGRLRGEIDQLANRDTATDRRTGPESGYRNEVGGGIFGSDDAGAGARLAQGKEAEYLGFLGTLDRNAPVEQNEAAIAQWWQQNGGGLVSTNSRQIAEGIRDGREIAGVNYGDVDAAQQQQLEAEVQRRGGRAADMSGGGWGQTADAAIRGAADTVSLGFADEIAAAGDTIFSGGTMEDNLALHRYVDRRDSETNFGARLGGQIAGAVALPYGRLGTTSRAGAIEGAGYGAAYGFGSGEGDIVDRLGSAAGGAFIGGTAGAGVNALMPYVQRGAQRVAGAFNARRGNALADFDPEIVAAGARQNIPIRQPDARPSTRADYGAAEASEGGNAIVQRAIADDTAAVQGRLREVGGTGQPLTGDNYALGELAQNATSRASNNLKTRAGRLYERVEALAPDARIPPTQTTRAINDAIASLQSNGANATSAEVNVLRGLAADFEQTGLTVGSLQTQRRRVRNLLESAGADPDVADAMLMDIMATAGRELEQGLASNPRALSALQQADQLWTERAILKREIGRLFVGTRNQPVAPETAAARLNQLLSPRGNSDRAAMLLREMEPFERADLRATIVENILNTRSGEAGFGAISSNIRNLNPRVMREVFGEDGVAALRDIQAIAKAKADGLSRVNRSNTGVVTERNDGTFRTVMMSVFGGSVGGIPGAVAGGIGGKAISNWNSRRMARLLTNPDFTRLLRQAPNTTNPRVINRYFQRMDAIAARSPVMAADVQALQEFLRQSFTQSPTRALAEGQPEQDGRQIPPQ